METWALRMCLLGDAGQAPSQQLFVPLCHANRRALPHHIFAPPSSSREEVKEKVQARVETKLGGMSGLQERRGCVGQRSTSSDAQGRASMGRRLLLTCSNRALG